MNTDQAPELPAFQRYQLAFTAHIRDPKGQPRPRGVQARRMKVYNELLYNNVERFILACFPVLRQVLGVRKWRRLVRAFFAGHRSHTPYFRQIPDEFIQFLQHEWQPDPAYPDFLLELAHYEWIELALSVSTLDQQTLPHDAHGDLLENVPVLNPVLANLTYRYPVHRIGARFKPAVAPLQATHLLVFRNLADEVRFIVQNPVSARLVALLAPGGRSGRAALVQLATEMQHPDPQAVVSFGADILARLRTEQAILGSR